MVVLIDAKLVNERTRAIVQSLKARAEIDADANTVVAVVAAMNQALGQVLSQIVGWALTAPGPGKE